MLKKANNNLRLRDRYFSSLVHQTVAIKKTEIFTSHEVRKLVKRIIRMKHSDDLEISISKIQNLLPCGFNRAARLLKYFINKKIIVQYNNQLLINRRRIFYGSIYVKKKHFRRRELEDIKERITLKQWLSAGI
ncbi:MAG: hypothetical protein EKK57_08010 [Proteobacteria bacterium]|nr:MAG: hypothetical protein EKK57_08010 [Pseudomonadota bacterium]